MSNVTLFIFFIQKKPLVSGSIPYKKVWCCFYLTQIYDKIFYIQHFSLEKSRNLVIFNISIEKVPPNYSKSGMKVGLRCLLAQLNARKSCTGNFVQAERERQFTCISLRRSPNSTSVNTCYFLWQIDREILWFTYRGLRLGV